MNSQELAKSIKYFQAKTLVTAYVGNNYYGRGASVALGKIPGRSDCFVVGINKDYDIKSVEWCQKHLKTLRDEKGYPTPIHGRAPCVVAQDFQYKAQVYNPCPDECCGLEHPVEEQCYETSQEAFETLRRFKTQNPKGYYVVKGPNFQERV